MNRIEALYKKQFDINHHVELPIMETENLMHSDAINFAEAVLKDFQSFLVKERYLNEGLVSQAVLKYKESTPTRSRGLSRKLTKLNL